MPARVRKIASVEEAGGCAMHAGYRACTWKGCPAPHCLFPTVASVRSLAALARQVLEVVAGHRGITHREQLAEQLFFNAEHMFFGQRTTAV